MNQNILIVEDDPIIANVISEILEDLGYEDITSAYSYEQAIERISSEEYDLVLLDINLKHENDGVDVAKKIRSSNAKTSIIYITGNSDFKTVVRLKKTEPEGVLVKPFREVDLMILLEVVFHKSGVNDAASKKINGNIVNLTPREKEVLRQIVDGYSNKMIADRLGISERTVSVHRSNILKKFKAKNTADLVRLSLTSGMLPLE